MSFVELSRHSETMNIVITCLTKLKQSELRFFQTLISVIRAQGAQPILLSPHYYEELGCITIRLPTRWVEWVELYDLGELPSAEALEMLDVELWQRRVSHTVGDPLGRNDCSALLKKMAGFSLAMLRHLRPVAFVSWNPPDPTTGIMHELAGRMGISTHALERGAFANTFNCEPKRLGIYEPLSLKSWEELRLLGDLSLWGEIGRAYMGSQLIEQVGRYAQSRPDVFGEPVFDSRRSSSPKVLVLGNFDTACGISPGDPIKSLVVPGFGSGIDLAKSVAISHSGVTIFKPHPAMHKRLRFLDVRGTSNLVVGTGDPQPYLSWADVVVSYGSGLDFDALAMNKPVVLCGRSILFNKGITYEALSELELGDAIRNAFNGVELDKKLQRFEKFVGFLVSQHLIRADDSVCLEAGVVKWVTSMLSSAQQSELWDNDSVASIDSMVWKNNRIELPSRKLMQRGTWLARRALSRLRDFICYNVLKCR